VRFASHTRRTVSKRGGGGKVQKAGKKDLKSCVVQRGEVGTVEFQTLKGADCNSRCSGREEPQEIEPNHRRRSKRKGE